MDDERGSEECGPDQREDALLKHLGVFVRGTADLGQVAVVVKEVGAVMHLRDALARKDREQCDRPCCDEADGVDRAALSRNPLSEVAPARESDRPGVHQEGEHEEHELRPLGDDWRTRKQSRGGDDTVGGEPERRNADGQAARDPETNSGEPACHLPPARHLTTVLR